MKTTVITLITLAIILATISCCCCGGLGFAQYRFPFDWPVRNRIINQVPEQIEKNVEVMLNDMPVQVQDVDYDQNTHTLHVQIQDEGNVTDGKQETFYVDIISMANAQAPQNDRILLKINTPEGDQITLDVDQHMLDLFIEGQISLDTFYDRVSDQVQ